MALHAEAAPVAHDFLDVIRSERRLRAERVAAQVDELAPVRRVRQHESISPGMQRVRRVERMRVLPVQFHAAISWTG